jgi:hypothetical protein
MTARCGGSSPAVEKLRDPLRPFVIGCSNAPWAVADAAARHGRFIVKLNPVPFCLLLVALAACAPAETYQGRQLSCAGGVLGGAAAGGILGNQVGGGTGNDIATAVGAGLGALAGTQNSNCLAPAQARAQGDIVGYDRNGNAIYAAPPTQLVGYDRNGNPVYQ